MTAWCPQWREHPNAVQRLAAIHAQWIAFAPAGTLGQHGFYRDVIEHHLPVLTSTGGPFRGCLFNQGHVAHNRIDEVVQR